MAAMLQTVKFSQLDLEIKGKLLFYYYYYANLYSADAEFSSL